MNTSYSKEKDGPSQAWETNHHSIPFYPSHSFHIPPYPSLYTLLYSTISYRILFTIGETDPEPKQLYYLGRIVQSPKLDRNDPGQNDPAESTQGRNELMIR